MGPGLRRDKKLSCSEAVCDMTTGKLTNILLSIAFRHSITAPNVEAGFERIQAIMGGKLDANSFHKTLASCLRAGLIREPVRLPEGSLQCHWHLELTARGVETVRALLRECGTSADEWLDQVRGQNA